MSIATYQGVTPPLFAADIRPLNRPAVLKGVVTDWPAVAAGRESDEALVAYLKARDNGQVAGVYVGAPDIDGHFFYGADTKSENFRYGPAPIPQALDRLLAEKANARPTSVYVQSAELFNHMPKVKAENRLELLPKTVEPRIWIGNRTVTRAHYDLNHNLACVVAGRRKFLLLPPEQLPNLYPGPFDRTIGGVPVAMVDPENPDLELYPRFALAQASMLEVDLEPGDALFIPYGWWHQVRSLSAFNVLVNYWWDDASPAAAQPYDALFHSLLALRDMPEGHKALWKTVFDYYVFNDDSLSHLPSGDRGSLGDLTPELVARIKANLKTGLG
ncbi:transcription factor jumonji domain-containing protein [Asticcacaulis biprosthecium C19]|uniref:Transcription factor jumonji domain-containing protein n=1 Tax=Asticcacaulis biprosthecium C19 TaxID=715226 RepID=F4QHX6_9CAUL|nr:cupin-like domain-containing protein [Asticcacaulis biprosthecium]EGF91687.1 transcription factor jumonji domain-containing protein [Asticcacaulis biprosthecium C19]